jgi:Protein of unknown function (DUF2752)
MQLVRRPIAPRELDYELLGLTVSLGGLGAAAVWFSLHLPWPICLFHAITGHPCVTCGATRSAIAFFHADLSTAWKWNPLVFVTLCTLSIFDAYAFVALVTRGRRLRIVQLTAREKNFIRVAAIALLAINWLYLLIANPNL